MNMWKSFAWNADYLLLHGFTTNQKNDQLPASLSAQLVERCTGVAKIRGWTPVRAGFFVLFFLFLVFFSGFIFPND